MKTSLFTAIAVTTTLISTPVLSEILFDIDFSAPLHTNGQAITIDSSINTPTRQTFGSTEMITGYAGLTGNWAIFNQSDCSPSDQIKLALPDGIKTVYFEADIYTQHLSPSDNTFNISTDSSNYGIRNTSFHGLGNLRVFNFDGVNLASFSNDQLYHVKLHADVPNDLFIVEINGSELYSSTLGSSDITAFRLTMTPWTGSATDCTSPVAAVSNIFVYETPEDIPSSPEPEVVEPVVTETEISESQAGSVSGTLLYLFVSLGFFRFTRWQLR